MFVNIIHFPPIKAGKEAEYRERFGRSNERCAEHGDFISRRLLKPREGGNHAAIVEHESYETFMAGHTSSTQANAHEVVMG